MRSLAQPEVLKSAATAALATAVVCYPRMAWWPARVYPIWYLEAVLFLGGIVLWGFVFAWHTQYTRRPVFQLNPQPRLWALTTLAGVGLALVLGLGLDPALRARHPADYPLSFDQWLTMTLFTLGFSQLFLVFAPFAWFIRLFQSRPAAVAATVLFGVFVLIVRNRSSPAPLPGALFLAVLMVRVATGLWSIYLYLRGGVMLVWWWGLLVQGRFLLELADGADR